MSNARKDRRAMKLNRYVVRCFRLYAVPGFWTEAPPRPNNGCDCDCHKATLNVYRHVFHCC